MLTGMTLDDLHALAESIGVSVVYTSHAPYGLAGGWVRPTRTIFMQYGLDARWETWALAHELVHALHGDDGCQPAHIEHARDSEAARMLITDAAYAAAEHEVGPDPRAVAKALDLPVEAVHAWRRGREPLRAA